MLKKLIKQLKPAFSMVPEWNYGNLKDSDWIFTNLYNDGSPSLKGA